MQDFRSYIGEAVNAHMTHISDLPFIEGVDGTRKAINFLRDLRNFLKGSSVSHVHKNKLSVKFDGAPAIFLGIDPADGKFFVAKKGIFNKNPKVYKTQADIAEDLQGDLRETFSILLKELSKLGIKSGIYQGDLMFTKKSVKQETIDGEEYITFHPNTIVYAVPVSSPLASKIQAANVGIAFHTEYSGKDFANLSASFGNKITPKFKKLKNVWAVDAAFEDASASATLSPAELSAADQLLSQIGSMFRSIDAVMLNEIHKDQELLDLVLIYINSKVKQNVRGETASDKARGFAEFIDDRYKKEIEKRASAAGKASQEEKRIRVLEYFKRHDINEIAKIFLISDMIDEVKLLLIGKMNQIGGLKHFVKTKNGFKITSPEGFVSINSDNEAVKLVDRFEFSQNNFSPEILKGWQR